MTAAGGVLLPFLLVTGFSMLRSLVAALLLSGASMSSAAPITYPATERGPIVETQHGTPVADPYRWLEGDVRTEKPVADWVAAQNQVTQA
jgi:prolyl oligopeptidase